MNSHEVFIHIHQGCFAGTGAIVRLPQCQWSKPDGYGKISQCITTAKHSKAKTVCIFLGIYCTYGPPSADVSSSTTDRQIHLHPSSVMRRTVLYKWLLQYRRWNEDFGNRSRHLRQGYVIAYHSILWDVITYPCLRYLFLVPKSLNMLSILLDFVLCLAEPRYLFNKWSGILPQNLMKSRSKTRDWMFYWWYRSEIWQVSRQRYCQGVCQIPD